jgi:folate-binding protein YgfZ
VARRSPIADLHTRAEALVQRYGPDEPGSAGVELVQTYGPFEAEYASVRKACGLLDEPHRACVGVTGADRLAFLNRMLTNDLRGLSAWSLRRAFWLNRKGRIDADLRILALPDRLLLEVDIHALQRTVEGLSAYIIADDVALENRTESLHRLSLHGPGSLRVLARFSRPLPGARAGDPAPPALEALAPDQVTMVECAGHEVVVARQDDTGEIGLLLFAPAEGARAIYQTLLQAAHEHAEPGSPPGPTPPNPRPSLRPIGWAAFNVARIEAGTPLYYIDFGPDSLPAETGLLNDRVSFTKGCYLGQEVVARMNALGHPRQRLVGLRFTTPPHAPTSPDAPDATEDRCPVTGSEVYAAAAIDARRSRAAPGGSGPPDPPPPIGAVTSATQAPMLSGAPVAFAMLKYQHSAPGTEVYVDAEGRLMAAKVQPGLTFWSRSRAP